MSKADYVRSAMRRGDTQRHHCHWPDCGAQVPPAAWGCKRHWYMLPKALRDRIWDTYAVGQEVAKTPSPAYIAAARAAQDWIAENYPASHQGALPL